ncbi:hypothetical protein [Bradyrhizobium macuxiense]|nr:hypothetical protein [Bradyrhizobium macuxiense]
MIVVIPNYLLVVILVTLAAIVVVLRLASLSRYEWIMFTSFMALAVALIL